MRFFHLVLPVAAGAVLFAGCGSSSTPVVSKAAVAMQMSQPSTCIIAEHSDAIGLVDDTTLTTSVADAQNGAKVSCTISGTKTFTVSATLAYQGLSLVFSIPAITTSASATSPAAGTLSYSSTESAGAVYQGACKFYFDNSMQTVATGSTAKIWTTFECDGLVEPEQNSTCPVLPSYLVLESCPTESVANTM